VYPIINSYSSPPPKININQKEKIYASSDEKRVDKKN